jgi:hypothetical protein
MGVFSDYSWSAKLMEPMQFIAQKKRLSLKCEVQNEGNKNWSKTQ